MIDDYLDRKRDERVEKIMEFFREFDEPDFDKYDFVGIACDIDDIYCNNHLEPLLTKVRKAAQIVKDAAWFELTENIHKMIVQFNQMPLEDDSVPKR